MPGFREKYGRFALVAGASEGLGAAFADGLARRGMDLVLLARRAEALESTARGLRSRHGVEVRTLAVDLAAPGFLDAVAAATEGLEIGLVVHNAAFSVVGPYLAQSVEDHLRCVDVNVRAALLLTHRCAGPMATRKRGAFVFMSSLSAFQGTGDIAVYAAAKAFDLALAEGLWEELRPHGIDVVACAAGGILTSAMKAQGGPPPPGTLAPEAVAEAALDRLGRGPSFVPGLLNKVVAWLFTRVLPRRTAISIISRETRKVRGAG